MLFRSSIKESVGLSIFIAVILFLFIYFAWLGLHNFWIKRKYSRYTIENDENFEIVRCLEETGRRVYIINKDKGICHHIADKYTLDELGFGSEDALRGSDKCFSKSDYGLGKRIQIFDISKKIDIFTRFKNLILNIDKLEKLNTVIKITAIACMLSITLTIVYYFVIYTPYEKRARIQDIDT